jgi:hypothetical protein
MKGFASYCDPGNTLYGPSSMAFEEIGWDKLEPVEGQYSFGDWEAKFWDQAPAKGKHVVLRVYLDYPSKPSSVPKWLIAKGVKMTKYDEFGGGETPEYENPELVKSLLSFIKAFGSRYDHDARVDYVQVGFLGHWGEWHTYPHENLFASVAVQRKVISALHTAFPNKPIMARNASYASCQVPWIGFHDDMIPSDTFGKEDWEFLPAIVKGGVGENWKVAPTGGEMVPGAAKQYLGREWPLLERAVKEAHFTWIGPYCPAMVADLTSEEKSRMEELIRMLGYQFQLKSATIATSEGDLAVQISGVNQGVAPFYQPWKVRLALLKADGTVAASQDLGDDIRKWVPGGFAVEAKLTAKVEAGVYRLGIGIVDPSTGKPGVRFANDLAVEAGYTVIGPVQLG